MAKDMMARPELTFPPEVAEWVREEYSAASVILEYGSGGSTVMASEMPDKTIYTVESDKRWSKNLQTYLDQAGGPSPVQMHYVRIGKTGKWGRPVDASHYRRYHRYALSIWDQPEFQAPNVVLIDGRFREACFYATMLRCTKKTTVLFDDYTDRRNYQAVEELIKPVEVRGRMAKFVLQKKALPREHLTRIVGAFNNPF